MPVWIRKHYPLNGYTRHFAWLPVSVGYAEDGEHFAWLCWVERKQTVKPSLMGLGSYDYRLPNSSPQKTEALQIHGYTFGEPIPELVPPAFMGISSEAMRDISLRAASNLLEKRHKESQVAGEIQRPIIRL